MRIVSGTLKGRRFSPPKSFKARPTTDTARESLFNILNNIIDFEETSVLDLFSGTGAISYEFASRGCPSVTSIEKDFHHLKFIHKCIAELDLMSTVKALKGDVFTYLKQKGAIQFDLIFADPPFDMPFFDEVVPAVLKSELLKEGGLFIIEHGPNKDYSSHENFWQLRKYGKVCFTFFSKQNK